MRHHLSTPFGRIIKVVTAIAIGLVLSVVGSSFAAAHDPTISPTPSASPSGAASPSPTASVHHSVTPTGSRSASPSTGTAPDVTVSSRPEASTASPAEHQSPNAGVEDAHLGPVISVSGVLRDATTGAPIRNSCVAYRPASVTSTATNGTTKVRDKGRWAIDGGDPGPFYISFYVTADGDCSHPVLTGSGNHRASWYRGHAFTGTNPSTALPPPGADPVPAGSNIVACLGTHNALPTACATPDRTASGRVVGVGNVPIRHACVVAVGRDNLLSHAAVSDAHGRWTLTGLPINYDYIVGVIPTVGGSEGSCHGTDGPLPRRPAGELQPEFYDDTWIDFSDQRLEDDAFGWATDPDSPHPAVTLRNNRTGIDFCLTTETGRTTERGSCEPTRTATSSPAPSMKPTLAATGGPSVLAQALGAALLLNGVGLLAWSRTNTRCGLRRHSN